jgi:hypothetical protein
MSHLPLPDLAEPMPCRRDPVHEVRRRPRPGLAALALAALLGLAPGLGHAQAATPRAVAPPLQPAPPASAPAACPPVAQAPTPEQLKSAAGHARDHGFLWRIRKDGHASWLYGTLHVGKLDWAFPGPQVGGALRAADTVALELDLTDPGVVQQLGELSRAPAAMPPLPAALGERIARQVAAACLPPQLLAGQHPLMQAMTLTVLEARRDGLDAGYAQELVLAGMARATAKPLVSLETPQLQMAALLPTDAAQAVLMTEQTIEQLEQGKSRHMLRRMARVWEKGQLDELARYEDWCDCVDNADDRALLHRLNDERNPQLAEHIAALHAQGKAVFAAVGSLHMTGPASLPTLMAGLGFTVERVAFAPAD